MNILIRMKKEEHVNVRGKGLLIFFVEYVDANSFQLEMKRIFLFLKKNRQISMATK